MSCAQATAEALYPDAPQRLTAAVTVARFEMRMPTRSALGFPGYGE
jgi:hypothetical protein